MAKKRKKNSVTPIEAPMRSMRKEVSIERVNNGFVVSLWANDKHKRFIAKDKKVAKQMATDLL